jgi:hypothetical protein
VRPPLSDCENAIASAWPLLKLASCQTAYNLPLDESTAMSGMISPVRDPRLDLAIQECRASLIGEIVAGARERARARHLDERAEREARGPRFLSPIRER